MPAFDQLTLSTRRLLLRPLLQSDAPSLVALYTEPEVMRYWSNPVWSSIDQATELIDWDLRAMTGRPEPQDRAAKASLISRPSSMTAMA